VRVGLVTSLAAHALVAPAGDASAHTPHDPIEQLLLSPNFADDATGFLVSDGRVLRSDDGLETFVEVVDGLNSGAPTWLATSPADPSVVYVAMTTGEVFRSEDGGRSFPARLVVQFGVGLQRIAVASNDPDIVVVTDSTGAVSRSTDGGENWSSVTELDSVTELVADSSGVGRFYAGDTSGQTFFSDDGGSNWQLSNGPPSAAISSIADSVDTGSFVVMTTVDGDLLASLDGGANFALQPASGLPRSQVFDVSIGAGADSAGPVIWATSGDGPYRSTDSGVTFEPVHTDITLDSDAAALDVPSFGTIAVASDATAANSAIFLAGFDGLFTLDLAADRWLPIETRADAITGVAVSPTFSTDRTIAVATYVKGAYISTDGGSTFESANAGLDQPVGRSNTVLPVRRLQNVVFSPNFTDDQTLFGATGNEFLTSHDAGASWQRVAVVPSNSEDATPSHFVIGVGKTTIGTAVLIGSRQGVVYRSDRRGVDGSWAAIADLGGPIRSVALSPDFAETTKVFATTDAGVFRSTDGGVTFELVDSLVRNGILSVSPDFARDATIFAGSRNGLAVSRNGGDTWERVGVVFSPTTIEAIGISPAVADDGTVLVSVRGEGLFRSVDRGVSFEPVTSDLFPSTLEIAALDAFPTANPIQFADDGTVVAYADGAVVISNDGGASWNQTSLPSFDRFVPSETPAPPIAPSDEPTETSVPFDISPATDEGAPQFDPTDEFDAADSARDRKIWLVAGSVGALSLAGLLLSARRRR
jgi:photosystem II stability/assembly factor-like uncharacterized protein